MGVVVSLGRLIPWERQDHERRADPGTKRTVGAHGESLAAASQAAGGSAGGTPRSFPNVHCEMGGLPHPLSHRHIASLLSRLDSLSYKSGALCLRNSKLQFFNAALDSSLAK